MESPKKVETIEEYIGDNQSLTVLSTSGHMFDLPADEMGLDEDYNPKWTFQGRDKNKKQIEKAADDAETVYVATDPDREGEGIAWQVKELILDGNSKCVRIMLNSITKSEIREKIQNPGSINESRVRAQWARRILDRLVGYKISPFLSQTFDRKGLSAGRVQTPVLHTIVERFREVEAFEPETFYNLFASVQTGPDELSEPLEIQLTQFEGDDIGTGDDERMIKDEDVVDGLVTTLQEDGVSLKSIDEKTSQSSPPSLLDSSSLLQMASSVLNWSSDKTMNVAQSLYEEGLITYHRSDSTRLSPDGAKRLKEYVNEQYGEEYCDPDEGKEGDQDAHEAIRPYDPGRHPRSVSSDEGRLYGLIWTRTIRSQMIPAEWDLLNIDFETETESDAVLSGRLRANSEPGFYRCQLPDETTPVDEERPQSDLETFQGADDYRASDVEVRESETRGPSLFTEGQLIGWMKEEGIGRPSTYSSTIQRLRDRDYIFVEDDRIKPTDIGCYLIRYTERAIPPLCNVKLTRFMEETLDKIEDNEKDWDWFVEAMDKKIEEWINEAKKKEPPEEGQSVPRELEATCPECGDGLIERTGEYGKFIHCESDDCEFSRSGEANENVTCEQCGRIMVLIDGQDEPFYGCIAFPDCQGTKPRSAGA